MIRFCPNCQTERGLAELFCEGEVGDEPCNWDLSNEQIRPEGWRPQVPEAPVAVQELPVCPNGHLVEPGDLICLICGADISHGEEARASEDEVTVVSNWRLDRLLSDDSQAQRYAATHITDGREAILTLYATGSGPDHRVYEVLKALESGLTPQVLGAGEWRGRQFEAVEGPHYETFANAKFDLGADSILASVLSEVGQILAAFAERGLRHRGIRPEAILVRSSDPIDLLVTSFGSAQLTDFDLDIVAPLEITRYMAPESVVGGVTAASDWWSFGMVLLDHITNGACFAGADDQTFLIHVLTSGAPIPNGLSSKVDLLLRGLLARDSRERWQWPEIRRWLDGDMPQAPTVASISVSQNARQTIRLGGRQYDNPTSLALAAAQSHNWDEALQLLLFGNLVTWMIDAGYEVWLTSLIRQISALEGASEDFRLSLALQTLNPSMPLVCRGLVITPGWLLDHPIEGYELISGPIPRLLEARDAEPWLSRLKSRDERVRERCSTHEIEMNEPLLKANLLSTSMSRLAALWTEKRRLLPDSDHPHLLALLDRRIPSDEDLILLLSADSAQFNTADKILSDALQLARRARVQEFDSEAAREWLLKQRRDIYGELDSRLENFARCGRDLVDDWADQYRIERRLPIARALNLLAVPRTEWRQPPKQSYFANLLDFYTKRISAAAMRGPLTRLLVGKTSTRIDITDLGSARKPAVDLLNHILMRTEKPVEVDPGRFFEEQGLERRVRGLFNKATTYRRDTGIDGLYLGFPFLSFQESVATKLPRIAPILLWPVQLSPDVRNRGQVSLKFDRDREEVRLNPTFETMLGPEEASRWQQVADEVHRRASLTVADVLEAFGALAVGDGKGLTPLPDKNLRLQPGQRRLCGSGVLFHLSFIGQAVNEDLRKLKSIPPLGSSLEAILRIDDPIIGDPAPEVPHANRYFTADSDPSQEAAVMEAREPRGLVIEGPPGTGKSQTIVNMVADAIGRGKTLLLVCQKQAALDVVRKRLEAEGLSNRISIVTDVSKDRLAVIAGVREQLESLSSKSRPERKHRRDEVAARLTALENDLDTHRNALYSIDPTTGLSYREISSQLIGLANEAALPNAPVLRLLLGPLTPGAVAMLEDNCAPLARLWLPSQYEGNALISVKAFGHDPGLIQGFESAFGEFQKKEAERAQTIALTPGAISITDPAPYHDWLELHAERFLSLTDIQRERLAKNLKLFESQKDSVGDKALVDLGQVLPLLEALPQDSVGDREMFAASGLTPDGLEKHWITAEVLATPPIGFAKFSPTRWLRKFLQAKSLRQIGIDDPAAWHKALTRERAARPLRDSLHKTLSHVESAQDLRTLQTRQLVQTASKIFQELSEVRDLCHILLQHPSPTLTISAARVKSRAAFENLIEGCRQGYIRFDARRESFEALEGLKLWMDDAWTDRCRLAISQDGATVRLVSPIEKAMPTLVAYQRFRARAAGLNVDALKAFAALRPCADSLQGLSDIELDRTVRHLLRKESRLAWKARMESEQPSLLFEANELESMKNSLIQADKELRDLNRLLLMEEIDRDALGTRQQWEDITRVRGPRSRRLREFLDRGVDIGLMNLRPVWLMNPDVASRLLPLTKALFDTVIYDEASQMPIEYALPTLFRGRKALVSGDEKQLPPTSFFSSRVENDEAEIYEEDLDDDRDDQEREIINEAWNRREIKDCPDLLQLAKTVLPSKTLQIHYRSSYRELIQFSNAAFYGNRLSIPVQHPDDEVRRVKPIELIRVDGIYQQQTNPAEAEAVIEILERLWAVPLSERKTVGVVTFNRKQADLVQQAIDDHAMMDPEFARVLSEERDRTDGGEDVGFFVKNVENVQGDERDVIIFSSTFGRNENGVFRRSFGVLGQSGGERRLNVAVTRAKEKIVIVTSMVIPSISDFLTSKRVPNSPRDFLQAYFEYARLVSEGELETARTFCKRLTTEHQTSTRFAQKPLDGFQIDVKLEVRKLGWEPIEVPDEGAFGFDFAIENPRTGLYGIAIECDSPRHILLEHARAGEMWRPSVLRRGIPVIHRVSSQRWLHEPDSEKARLREAIESALGVSA